MPHTTFIEGEPVELCPIDETDLDFLQAAINEAGVWRGIGRTNPINDAQEREFYEDVVCNDESVNLLITSDGTPVGTVGFNKLNHELGGAELGYWVAPEQQGEGYGTEATELLVDYGSVDRNLHRIAARVFEFNEPSRRLLESVGFTQEGVHREVQYAKGGYQDVIWYGLLEDEWNGTALR